MKRVFSTLLILWAMLLILASNPVAQDLKMPVDFYLGVGTSVPTGDFANGRKFGIHGLARIGYSVTPKFDVLAGIEVYALRDDRSDSTGGPFSIIDFVGDLKVNFGTPGLNFNPFLLGGAGVSHSSLFLLEAGGGVEFNKFFAQIKYINMFRESGSYTIIPFTLGVKF